MSDPKVIEVASLPDVGKLIARAIATGVLPGRDRPSELANTRFLIRGLEQHVHALADYDRVCGFPVANHVPPTWIHVLTFPLQTALMGEPDFPFGLAGLVHLSNTMSLHRPVSVAERLQLEVSAENLTDHRKGKAFEMVGRARVGDELVWEGRSSYLARAAQPKSTSEGSAPGRPERAEATLPPVSQLWRLPGDLGRQYAAVSGDVNPIHLSAVTARLFGFKRPIIHGMWTHARALAGLGGRLPDSYTVQVKFTKPILLPGKVSYGVAETETGWEFAVTNRQAKPYLLGGVTR